MVKNSFRKWLALGGLLLAVNTGSVVFAQEDQDQDPAVVEDPVRSSSSQPSITTGSGPWNAGSSRPSTRDVNSVAPSARPAGGSTTLDDDPPGPGGNPDVPFDSNMNIAFLVIGLVFAFVVYRKRFAVKSEPLNK